MSLRVNACIVAYENPLLMLKSAVNSVLQEKECVNRLYVVDNSPTDRLRQNCNPQVSYIFTGDNLGFGKANNIAMQKSLDDGIEYHLLVNPDISFEKGVIAKLQNFMDENPDVGW